jgi:hypothetical protein
MSPRQLGCIGFTLGYLHQGSQFDPHVVTAFRRVLGQGSRLSTWQFFSTIEE